MNRRFCYQSWMGQLKTHLEEAWQKETKGVNAGAYTAEIKGDYWEINPTVVGWILHKNSKRLGIYVARSAEKAMELVDSIILKSKREGGSIAGSPLRCSTPCRMHDYGPQCPGADGRKRS